MIQANPVQANSIFPFFLILLFKVKRKKIYYLILISKKEGLFVPGGSGSTQRMKIYCGDHCYRINFRLESPPAPTDKLPTPVIGPSTCKPKKYIHL